MRENISDEDGFEFVDHSSDDPVFVCANIKSSIKYREVVHDIGGRKNIFEFSKTKEIMLTNQFVPDEQGFFGIRVEFCELSDGCF